MLKRSAKLKSSVRESNTFDGAVRTKNKSMPYANTRVVDSSLDGSEIMALRPSTLCL